MEKYFIEHISNLVHEQGFSFASDSQTKEVLLVHKKEGLRICIAKIERLPKPQGFELSDAAVVAELFAGFLNSLAVCQKDSCTPEGTDEVRKLAGVHELKNFIRQEIYTFVGATESPILRDTITGLLASLSMEFATSQQKTEEG